MIRVQKGSVRSDLWVDYTEVTTQDAPFLSLFFKILVKIDFNVYTFANFA